MLLLSKVLISTIRPSSHFLHFELTSINRTCFATFVASKAIKRLEMLQRETRGPKLPARPQRYLLALSRGPSSAALLHILSENLRRQQERNRRVKFELVAAFVDVDVDVDVDEQARRPSSSPPSKSAAADAAPAASPPDPSTAAFAAHFPEIAIHTVPLSSILASPAVDWASLPAQDASLPPPPRRLAALLSRLPSASARADVARLLTRHALLAAAARWDCGVVLLGYTTTALAELTLAEAAKGRGFGIPWLVNDGAFPLPPALDPPAPPPATSDTVVEAEGGVSVDANPSGDSAAVASIQIYSPLREIFRKEVLTYLSIVSSAAGPLADLFPASSLGASGGGGGSSSSSSKGAVVSHRDLSLDDVVARYFVDVEAAYPSVVANVVRTTGKLNRTAPIASGTQTEVESEAAAGRQCGLCGVRLDPLGDERWKGEIGEADVIASSAVDEHGHIQGSKKSRLCYGCDRSVKG